MNKPRQIGQSLVISMLLLALCLASPAGAGPIGFNPILDASGGDIYFPVGLGASGTLGGAWPSDPGKTVGVDADKVWLTGAGSTTTGNVSFELVFDLTGAFDPGEFVDPDQAQMELTLFDLDLKPVVVSGLFDYRETLTMSFRNNPGGPNVGTPLTLDESNSDAFGGPPVTNQEWASYTVPMKSSFGLQDADLEAINFNNPQFALWVTVGTDTEHIVSGKHWISKTDPENLAQGFEFGIAPEPGMLALLAIGALGVLGKRRRRS